MAHPGNYSLNDSAHYESSSSHSPSDLDDLFGDNLYLDSSNSNSTMFPSAFSSPAVPTMYEPYQMHSPAGSPHVGTVSPQDLLVSAPNSSAFTNLTSPSMYNESPEFEQYETSPMFATRDTDLEIGGDEPWFSLFPDANRGIDESKVGNSAEDSPTGDSPLEPSEELEVQEHLRKGRSQSKSSPNNKHSSVAGVNSRKRDKPLPPIVVEDPNDTIAMKRARNTLAARKSRQKKMEKVEELEGRIAELEQERDHWKDMALGLGRPGGRRS